MNWVNTLLKAPKVKKKRMIQFKNALIDADTYEDQLERIGYPDRWIRRYTKLIEGGLEPDA